MEGWGERALCIVRVQLTIAYLSSIKKQNKSYLPRIRTNQKTKKSGTQDIFSTAQEFHGISHLCQSLSACFVLLLFLTTFFFLLICSPHEPVCLIWPSSHQSWWISFLFCKSCNSYSEQLNSSFFEPDTLILIHYHPLHNHSYCLLTSYYMLCNTACIISFNVYTSLR